MTDALRRLFCVPVLYLLVGTLVPSSLQAQTVDVGGLAFLDYYYTISSPNAAAEGLHGFTYRRLYLTADFRLTEDFAGRARLEANEQSVGSRGPVPFVKDLYLRWNYSGDHTATLGVGRPPAFEVAERVWGYRSLEKMILDLQGVVSSRDFGLRFDGPLTAGGGVQYAAMLANNSGARPEADPYKRAYAQISVFPTERLALTVGADRSGHEAPAKSSTRISAFAGYAAETVRLGLEGFWANREFDDGNDLGGRGLSFFGAVRPAPKWELVGRIDRAVAELPGSEEWTTFVIGGVAFSPNAFVRFIPNLWMYSVDENPDVELLGRLTVEVEF